MGYDVSMSTRVHIVMEDELVARVDDLRGEVPRGAWIRGAIKMRAGVVPAADEARVIPAGHAEVSTSAGSRLVPVGRELPESEPFFDDGEGPF
jgi:hypothetical protein